MAVTAASCTALIKDYCANCTFAGIHFIADDTKHFLERILWLFLVILSWYGSALLIVAAWDAFITSPISFGVETTYLNWETKMPAVAVCESINKPMVYNISDTIWPPNGHLLDLEDALRDIAYFRGWSYALIDNCYSSKNPDPMCLTTNYRYYADLVRSDCHQFMKNCSYNGKDFDCCEYFQPIETDIGKCFILNSIQTQKPKPYPMICNRVNKQALLKFEVTLALTLYTLEDDEVPTITTLKSSTLPVQLGASYSLTFNNITMTQFPYLPLQINVQHGPDLWKALQKRQLSVRNIENDPLIVETTPEQRACHFHHENKNGVYPYYSYSACTVQCRKKAQLDMCGCNDHFMLGTNDSQRCNISGIACLHQNSNSLTILKPPWALRPGLSCNCLPSCDETEITVIKDVITSMKGKGHKKKAYIDVMLAYLATERFKRSVVRSRLDLVVSVGGTTGLFVGASVLSFVELIFFFTVRFASNILMEKRKRNDAISMTIVPVSSRIDTTVLGPTKSSRNYESELKKAYFEGALQNFEHN